jgi:predicted nucleotidyltransferase/uncharacterized protein (UPF0332 family)
MREKEVQELEEVFQNFVNEHEEALHLVAVYGSATRKTDVEGSDIDVLVLVDTTEEIPQWKFDDIRKDLEKIEEENNDYDLHIQPPKSLKKWWELALESEPWVITSIEDLQPIYDPENLSKTLKSFPSHYMENEVKSEEMLHKGLVNLDEVKSKVVKNATNQITENVVEAAKSIFKFQGERVPRDQLEARLREDLVKQRELMSEEDVELFSRVKRYNPAEVDFKELKEIFDKGLQFIELASDTVRKLELQRREWIVEESFAEIMEICKEVLGEEDDRDGLINDFRDRYIREGDISREYEEVLEDVLRFKKEKENDTLEDVKGEKLYSTSARLSDFKAAVENVTSYEGRGAEITEGEEKPDEVTSQYSVLNKFQKKLEEKFGDSIKASWILSIENILETEDFTVKVLVDEEEVEINELESFIEKTSISIMSDTDYRVHPDVLELSEYWRKLKAGDEALYSELRYATTLYDPEKIFLPIKQVIEDGRMEGTREAIQKDISNSVEDTIVLRDKVKLQGVNKMYNATVTFGQAMLVSKGLSVPVQKKVPEIVRKELVKEGDLDITLYEKIRHNIRYWKDYEHGRFNDISSEDLNEIYENLRKISSQAKEVVKEES